MRGTRAVAVAIACVMAALVGGACGSSGSSSNSSSSSSSSSANGDKAAFCKTNSDINAKLQTASTEAEVLSIFKSFENQFDSYVKNAPSEVKADAQKQVDAARKAIKDNDASQFQNDQDLQKAGDHVDTFCGVKSSSSSSTESSSSSSSASGSAAAACTLFDLDALNTATNLTWKVVDSSQPTSCVVQADNGNTVSMNLATTGGHGDEAIQGGKSACDPGTVQDVQIADGGFVCKSSGVNTAVAAFNGSQKLVAIAAVTFNDATDNDIQQALVALLKTFQAS